MALEDPSMAAAVRAELARDLTPAHASDMNRMIAGDANWEENLEIGFENPVDGVIGIGKGMVNGVSDVVELAARGVAYGDALGDTIAADIAGFVGLDGVAAAYDGMAAIKNEVAAAKDVPEFELTNRAQQGGAVAGTIIDIALAGKGLVTGAARLAARNLDDVTGGLNSGGDRLFDSLGSASQNHPSELADIRSELSEMGVEVVHRSGQYAYGPAAGAGGRLIIDQDASISAWRHEFGHAFDDLANGQPGIGEYMRDPSLRLETERRQYLGELQTAREIGDQTARRALIEDYLAERSAILGN